MTIRTINMPSKIGYGILLPAAVFLAYQFALIETTRDDGTWAGITLFFGLAWIMPGILLMNCWLIPFQWQRKRSAFLAGMMLPIVIGIFELFWLLGSGKEATILSTLLKWPALSLFLLFVPLIASIAYTVIRRGDH